MKRTSDSQTETQVLGASPSEWWKKHVSVDSSESTEQPLGERQAKGASWEVGAIREALEKQSKMEERGKKQVLSEGEEKGIWEDAQEVLGKGYNVGKDDEEMPKPPREWNYIINVDALSVQGPSADVDGREGGNQYPQPLP